MPPALTRPSRSPFCRDARGSRHQAMPSALGSQPQGGSKSNDLSSGCWEPRPGFWPHHPTSRRARRGPGSLVGLSFLLCRAGEGWWGRWGQLWAAWRPPPTLKHEARGPTAAPGAQKWRLSKIWGFTKTGLAAINGSRQARWASGSPNRSPRRRKTATHTPGAWDKQRGPFRRPGLQAQAPTPTLPTPRPGRAPSFRKPSGSPKAHSNFAGKMPWKLTK